jgi:hypothetical protein
MNERVELVRRAWKQVSAGYRLAEPDDQGFRPHPFGSAIVLSP